MILFRSSVAWPMEASVNLPDENSRQVRIRRIVADHREALRQRASPSVDEILAQNADLGDELRSQLLAVASETATLPPEAVTAAGEDTTTSPVSVGRVGAPVLPGVQVGDYRLLRELGRGGMGVVYEAVHIGSDRRLAVKLLSPDLPHTEQTTARFLNEASLAAGLSHPRTTFVYEAGESDGHFFISMELMPGRTLKDLVQSEGALPVNRAVDYILDVLEGLHAAHKSGVVHRDVKPSNCFLDAEGRVKVGDFGLSKSLVAAKDLTLSGTFLGTPQFAAPEQFGRGKVDHRTDVFATAATLYYLIAGEGPFQGDAAAVIAQIVADDPPLLTSLKSEVPASLSRVIARALHKDPNRRYKDAREFRDALMPYSTGGTSMADLGRRVAAFFLDIMLVNIVASIFVVLYVIGRFVVQGTLAFGNYPWVNGLVFLLYFAIAEGMFSNSLGKKWLGLRVVDQYGEPPGIPRAALRALIVPGLSWVLVDFVQWWIYSPGWQQDGTTSFDYSTILIPQFLAVLRGILCLVVCSSMRRTNGYRGLHEFVSVTRVVRPQVAETIADLPAVPYYAGVVAEEATQSIGGFSIGSRLGTSGSSRILVAHDQQLDRPVWIHLDDSEISVSRARRHLARTTRQRWLGEGTEGDLHWQAFEAINGAPLPEVARYTTIPWGTARHIWLQAAEELQAAIEDGTLPERLHSHQVWTDSSGRLRLSDQPLREPTETEARSSTQPDSDSGSSEATATGSRNNERAMRLLANVAELCTADDETPAEGLDLLHELTEHSDPAVSPQIVVERLRQFVGLPYRLRWDDRLGTLAIAAGLETTLLSPLPLTVASVLTRYQWPTAWSMSLAVMVGVATAALLGYLLRGGPAFWLTRVEIRVRTGPAPPGRCAWRNVLTWLPLVMLYATAGIIVGTLIRTGSAPESQFGMIMLAVYQSVFGLVALLGALYAVIQPRCGLQDLLSGTFLVRRVSS